MKLITLNIWGGIVFEPLMAFIEEHTSDIDIFCFQENIFGYKPEFTQKHKARINIFSEIEKRLPNHAVYKYHAPEESTYFQMDRLPAGDYAGQAIFVKKPIMVSDSGGFRTYKKMPKNTNYGGKNTGNCQWIKLNVGLTVLNLHGLWQADTHKLDTPERLYQSQIVQEFAARQKGRTILCGDFNLKPDTESMNILENGMENLVKKYGITSTRSSLYEKPCKFADYILVSPSIVINRFEALLDEVSDHLPLLLEFE